MLNSRGAEFKKGTGDSRGSPTLLNIQHNINLPGPAPLIQIEQAIQVKRIILRRAVHK